MIVRHISQGRYAGYITLAFVKSTGAQIPISVNEHSLFSSSLRHNTFDILASLTKTSSGKLKIYHSDRLSSLHGI